VFLPPFIAMNQSVERESCRKPPLLVSVVVIGRNEGEALVRCMRAVGAMDYPAGLLEKIYVDSASTDGSAERAEQTGFDVIRVENPKPTAAKGRNAGWRRATGDYVLFLDGDTEVLPRFLVNNLGHFADPTIVAVCGRLVEAHPEKSVFNRVLELDWPSCAGRLEFCGGNALFRRTALEFTGGFDEKLVAGEEPDLCRKLRASGRSIVQVDERMALHDLGMESWSAYFQRCSRSGFAYAEVSRRSWNTSDPLWRTQAVMNLVQGIAYQALPFVIFGACIALADLWPALGLLAIPFLLIGRTMWRCRHRTHSTITLLLYAIHSHAAQVPIFWGQVTYWRTVLSSHDMTQESSHRPRSLMKKAMVTVLVPLARLLQPVFEGLRRILAHVALASRMQNPLPSSVVVLGTPEVRGTGAIRCGSNMLLYKDTFLETKKDGFIDLGDSVVLSRGVHISAAAGVTIGAGTMIGEYTSIRDANHLRLDGLTLRESGHSAAAIVIGEEVWIGRGVTVVGGVTIGRGSTIGANAVVTRDVDPDDVVAGVPARSILRPFTSARPTAVAEACHRL
jgi:acetyltransferase-like isoleucine patch superfamily enzyme/GT2 family glycosyltransferase